MSRSVCELALFIFSTTIVALEAGSPSFHQPHHTYSRNNNVEHPVRQIMGSSRKPFPKKRQQTAPFPLKKHDDDMLGSDGPLANGVYKFLTPWPYKFITNTTHPLMVKILLVVVAPILCVLIALQAYVTYFGPSNSFDGSWTVPLSPPGEPWVVPG